MPLLKYVKKIPAGTMVVPLLLASILNTFTPQWLYIGGYTQAVFTQDGMNTLLGLMMLFTGCQMSFKDIPKAIEVGGIYVLSKYIVGAGFYLLVAHFFGFKGIFGVCSLAILCAMTNCNGSMYMGLIETYGDNIDMAARPMFNVNSGPTLSLITLGLSGAVTFGFKELMALILPLIVGIVLANIDPAIKEASKNGTSIIMPILGFCLGAGIDLYKLIESGISGVILLLLVYIVTGPMAIFVDKVIFKKPGYAALSTVSVAGNTLAVPAAIASIAPEFLPYVESAMIAISGAIVLSAIFTPIMVHLIAKKYGCPKYEQVFGHQFNK